MTFETVPGRLAICRLEHMPSAAGEGLYSLTRTDKEISLVCASEFAPGDVLKKEDGWRAFRVSGTLSFSLTGILSAISGILADKGIGLFALSTYDTDYILVREDDLHRAAHALRAAGHSFVSDKE